jgi:hypothetical protein
MGAPHSAVRQNDEKPGWDAGYINSRETALSRVQIVVENLSIISIVHLLMMAVPLATAASHTPASDPQDLPIRELMKYLVGYQDLFEHIAEHPQAGVYHRYTKEWAFCLPYLESEVARRYRDAWGFCEMESGVKGNSVSGLNLRRELLEKMKSLFDGLEMHSKHLSWSLDLLP